MRGNFTTNRNGMKNPNYKHGLKGTRVFRIWSNMKTRCNNPNSNYYKRYGGRGIKVCDEWNDFQVFYDWAMSNGYNDNLSIDRINNNGNYEPSNCRWVDMKTQGRNRCSNHLIIINGETKTIEEWCVQYNINRHTVQDRLKRGWDEIRAIVEPPQTKFRKKVVL